MKMCMFLCFHVNFKHESTRTCMFPCKFSNILVPPFTPPLYHNGKGSIEGNILRSTGFVQHCRVLKSTVLGSKKTAPHYNRG